ncbi:hypothetical protein HETIRDRAFT_310269, partial [Heterobasidion irregulare TC 32-1]
SPPAQLRLDLLSDLSITASVNDPNIYRIFDDEVAFLHNTICVINVRCNDIILMHHLPSETLVHVFYFLAVINPPWICDLGWIKISYICRYWREVALEYQKLWSIINLDLGKSCVLEMSTCAK